MLIRLRDTNDTDLLVNTDHIVSAIPTEASGKCRTLLIMAGNDDNLLVQQDIDDILAKQKS